MINENKTDKFAMYLYNLFAKGLKEIIFTQNTSFLFSYNFHHHLELLC